MPADRVFTKTTVEAARLLGQLIKLSRKKRKMSESQLAERAQIGRTTVQKIEKGDPSVNIGLVFEAASVVGVPLFGAENARALKSRNELVDEKLVLLSHKPGRSSRELKDDF